MRIVEAEPMFYLTVDVYRAGRWLGSSFDGRGTALHYFPLDVAGRPMFDGMAHRHYALVQELAGR